MELTTKAEPIFGKFKGLGGFCVSSFWALNERMKMKHIVGIIGIVITIIGWFIGNSGNFHVVNRLLAPKYHNALLAYKKMHNKGFILQENDIGFREISKIIENHLEGDNIPTLNQIETVDFGTSFVNTENGQETQKYIEFKLTFANNGSIFGKIRMLDEEIKDNYWHGTDCYPLHNA